MLISYRYSHTGKVCSGDYSESELLTQDVKGGIYVEDDKYGDYYMREEGSFFYYYIYFCILISLMFIILSGLVGSCLFMMGSATGLKMFEEMVLNI